MDFYSIENYKQCCEAFSVYLSSHRISEPEDFKVHLYERIKTYRDSEAYDPKDSIRDMNNNVLRSYLDDILIDHNKSKSKKIAGGENVESYQAMIVKPPELTSDKGAKKQVDSNFERLLADRKAEGEQPQRPQNPFMTREPQSYFSSDASDIRVMVDKKKETPNEFVAKLLDVPLFMKDENTLDNQYEVPNVNLHGKLNHDYSSAESIKHYVSVNGFDRDWTHWRKRYNFSIDLENRFRNVREIKANSLILPMEIHERKTLNMIPKTNFVHEYGLQYPYVILNVQEASGVYSGTNSAVRSAFTKFVYDSSYRSPNGRGYMLMKPIQNESKIFRPAPLASLSSICLSIRKPNGTLYNNSIDDFGIFKVEHEAWNNMYLKVVLDKYFDRNEFYIGDSIIMRNFKLPSLRNNNALERFATFMNRLEGHEIVEIGKANSQGFHDNFYILAPGELDQLSGVIKMDTECIDALNSYNNTKTDEDNNKSSSDEDECTEESTTTTTNEKRNKIGDLINASLQNVLAFTVITMEGDVSCLNVSLIGTGG